jgi:hypothetical protein
MVAASGAALALHRELALGREVRFPDGSSRAGRLAPPVEGAKFNDHPRSPIHGAAAPRRSGAVDPRTALILAKRIRHNRRAGPVAECPKPAEAVLVDMAGVGLEAASLKAAAYVKAAGASGQAAAARVAADNPGKAAHAATAMAATAAARIRANATEGQSSSHEKSRKRSFDRWTHDNLSFSVHQLCRDC